MTFLSTFLKFLFSLLAFAVLGFFSAREIILYLASQQLVSDVRFITQPSRWDQLVTLCSPNEVNVAETPFDGFQVRFLSANEYRIETHCLNGTPAPLRTMKFRYGVKKTTGSAGFFYDFANKNLTGEVTLEFLGQKRIVFSENALPGQNWGSTQLRSGVPASVCAAHGAVCCDAVHEVGQGEALQSGVTDCSARCYSSCLKRPILLSFNSDPVAEHEARQIIVPQLEASIIFSYLFDDVQSPVNAVRIEFGDGTSQDLKTHNGQISKEYRCATAPCVYRAKILGTDERGISSAQTRLSEIEIILGLERTDRE